MVNKRGFIRVLEAIISIVLLLVIIYTFLPEQQEQEFTKPFHIKDAEKFIIKSIIYNETIRDDISHLSDAEIKWSDGYCNKECMESYSDCPAECKEVVKKLDLIISTYLPFNHEYKLRICRNPSCTESTPDNKNVFMFNLLVAPMNSEIKPTIIRIWTWEN